jgi:DNA-directed RNA polymerase subunit K/omega
MVPWQNDKSTVVALREIAQGLLRNHTFIDPESTN